VLTHVCRSKSDPEIETELRVNRRRALNVWTRERDIGAKGVAAKLRKAAKEVQKNRVE
jgi:hypothetical protein